MTGGAFSQAYSQAFNTASASSSGGGVQTAPCSWPLLYPGCDPADPDAIPEPLASLTDEQRETYESIAATYLWNWSGRRFGVCDVTIRPCRQDCWLGVSTFTGGGALTTDGRLGRPYGPVLLEGRWFNISCGRCGDTCSCDYTPTLHMPGPAQSVSEVRIDGEVLSELSYRVDNHHLLIRTDGGDWPTCQDMGADPFDDDNDDNTFAITYQRGIPVPEGGQLAAGVLANEFAKAACGDKDCQLPQRVQTVSRQGVTVAMLDAFDDIDTGHTGIWIIDSWVASVTKTPTTSRVYSPDIPRSRPRRTTWPTPLGKPR